MKIHVRTYIGVRHFCTEHALQTSLYEAHGAFIHRVLEVLLVISMYACVKDESELPSLS